MRVLRWTASLWPGFVRAWAVGRWRSLVWAVAFSLALNLALVATLWGEQWRLTAAARPAVIVAWLLVLSLWVVGLWRERTGAKVLPAAEDTAQSAGLEVAFAEAQHEYLRGHWLEAELLAARLLNANPQDIEARLLLASIQRRTGRFGQATATLRRVLEDDSRAKWLPEIDAEMIQIEQLATETTAADANAAVPDAAVPDAVDKRAA